MMTAFTLLVWALVGTDLQKCYMAQGGTYDSDNNNENNTLRKRRMKACFFA